MEHNHAEETFFDRLTEMLAEAKNHLAFLLIAFAIMVLVLGVTILLEKQIAKKHPFHRQKGAARIAGIGVFSAIGGALTLFEIPMFGFYYLDFSEVPALLAGFLMGPIAGVIVEFIKVFIHILFHGTHSAFVGEFAMFVIGCSLVIPASSIYLTQKTKRKALLCLAVSSLIMVVFAAFFNGLYLVPKYAELYGISIEELVGQLQDSLPAVRDVWTLIGFATIPFNLIKAVAVCIPVFFIYKPLSRLYHKIA